MKKEYLNYIICPWCSSKLKLLNDETCKNEVKSGLLICKKKHKYLVRKFVPRFTYNIQQKDISHTKETFSHKWSHSKNYGFTKNTKKFVYAWFFERYNWNDTTFKNFIKSKK